MTSSQNPIYIQVIRKFLQIGATSEGRVWRDEQGHRDAQQGRGDSWRSENSKLGNEKRVGIKCTLK